MENTSKRHVYWKNARNMCQSITMVSQNHGTSVYEKEHKICLQAGLKDKILVECKRGFNCVFENRKDCLNDLFCFRAHDWMTQKSIT